MSKAKKLPSGNWRVRVFLGEINGKKSYKSITAPTRREAEYLAAKCATKKKSNICDITVGEAVDRYIESKTNVLSPTTIEGYRKLRQNHIKDIEKIKLENLTNERIQRWINMKAMSISAKTISNMYGLLHSTLSLLRPDYIPNIRLPRRTKKLKQNLPTSEDVMKAVHNTPIELPVLLALCLCLRMSEVRGIKKTAIDGDLLYIENVMITVGGKSVEKELAKTDSSRRVVRIPERLKNMILERDEMYATTLTAKAIYSRFTRLMKKHGFDNVRFHDLRHIAASDMNRLGISDRVAADRGGWATTSTMRNIYQHSFTPDRDHADQVVLDYYESLLGDDKK